MRGIQSIHILTRKGTHRSRLYLLPLIVFLVIKLLNLDIPLAVSALPTNYEVINPVVIWNCRLGAAFLRLEIHAVCFALEQFTYSYIRVYSQECIRSSLVNSRITHLHFSLVSLGRGTTPAEIAEHSERFLLVQSINHASRRVY